MRATVLTLLALFAITSFGATREQARRLKLEAELNSAIASGQDFFAQDALYELTARDSETLPKKLTALYMKYVAESLTAKVTSALGKRYLALLIDPGIADRVDAFIDFSLKLPNLSRMSLGKIHQAFADSLGEPVTVYRGMRVTDGQLEFLLANGIAAPEFERHYDFDGSNKTLNAYLMNEFTGIAPKTLADSIKDARGPDVPPSLVAITEYEQVAEGVGNYFGRKGGGNRKLQVFKIKVPAIRVLRSGGILYHRWDSDEREMRFWDPTTGLALNTFNTKDPRFEAYIPGFIPKGWIESVEAKEVPKAQWDHDSNYAVFNYDRVRWEKGWSVIGSGIPFSADDFFSVLRNEPDTVFNVQKLLSFLREKAGSKFKLQLIHQLTIEHFAVMPGDESQNERVEREAATKLQNMITASADYPQVVQQLLMDEDLKVQSRAIEARQRMMRNFDSELYVGTYQRLVAKILKDRSRPSTLRLLAARKLASFVSAQPLPALMGRSEKAFYHLFAKLCVETWSAIECVATLDTIREKNAQLAKSPDFIATYAQLNLIADSNYNSTITGTYNLIRSECNAGLAGSRTK